MKQLSFLILLAFALIACESCDPDPISGISLTHIEYSPTSFDLEKPANFPELEIPSDNPLTVEKIELGRHLFYDPILSADSTMSCASCHLPELAFTDNLAFSEGIDGIAGNRSSMSIVNVGFYYTGLFWDGRSQTLEDQAILPVEDPIELHNNWPELMEKLRSSELYQRLFREAFGIDNTLEMTKELAAKAISSFERVIISGDAKIDRFTLNIGVLTDEELEGFEMFFDINPDLPDAECGHCHSYPLMTTNEFRNNGISEADDLADFPDKGYGTLTGNPLDNGKFRSPSLRNIQLSGPYMHDGRFETLREVIEHYNSGGKSSPNKDPLIYPLGLTEEQKDNLEAFLHTMLDTSYLDKDYITNPFD